MIKEFSLSSMMVSAIIIKLHRKLYLFDQNDAIIVIVGYAFFQRTSNADASISTTENNDILHSCHCEWEV